MRLLVAFFLILILCTCTIIPEDAGQDIPTKSTIDQLDFISGTNNAVGNYTISGDKTTIEWVDISGTVHGIDPTLPEPSFTIIEETGTRISAIIHTSSNGSEMMAFEFVYNLSKLDTIFLRTPLVNITDVFHYAITGIIDSVSRTTEILGDTPEFTKGLLVPQAQGYVLIDPYDSNEPGPGNGAFDNTGSVNWLNAIFSSGNSGSDNGNVTVLKGIDGGIQEQYSSFIYENEKDPFSSEVTFYEILKEHWDSNGNLITIDNYLNPLFLKPNNFFTTSSHLLFVLYGNFFEGGEIQYPGNQVSMKYNFIQQYE